MQHLLKPPPPPYSLLQSADLCQLTSTVNSVNYIVIKMSRDKGQRTSKGMVGAVFSLITKIPIKGRTVQYQKGIDLEANLTSLRVSKLLKNNSFQFLAGF
jgi:hypothetical protein